MNSPDNPPQPPTTPLSPYILVAVVGLYIAFQALFAFLDSGHKNPNWPALAIWISASAAGAASALKVSRLGRNSPVRILGGFLFVVHSFLLIAVCFICGN